MQKLATSYRQPTGSSSESELSTSQPRYATERARLLFGSYRRGGANDPDTYVAAVAAVLADYPPETIRHVTDPRTGLPAHPVRKDWTGLPDVADVRTACENHHQAQRYAQEWEAGARKLEAERNQFVLVDHRARPGARQYTHAEFEREFPGQRAIGRFEQGPLRRDAIPDANVSGET